MPGAGAAFVFPDGAGVGTTVGVEYAMPPVEIVDWQPASTAAVRASMSRCLTMAHFSTEAALSAPVRGARP